MSIKSSDSFNSWGNLGSSVLVVGSNPEQNDAHFNSNSRTPRRSLSSSTSSSDLRVARQPSKVKLVELLSRTIKDGYIYKYGHRFGRWNKRWFVLCKDLLYYYRDNKSKSETVSKGAIRLSQYASVEVAEERKGKFCMKLSNPTNVNMRPLFFGIDDEHEMQEWVKAIQEVLQAFKNLRAVGPTGRAKWYHSLYLRVAEARNLTTQSDASRGKSDCYCLIQLGEQCFRTQTAWKNAAPFWGEEYNITITDPNTETLNVVVFDEEPGSKDTPLGRLTIQTKSLQPSETTEQWFPLVPEDYKNFVSGDIKLSVIYIPGETAADGKLKIAVLEARNLASKDTNGLSDPYVVIQVSGEKKKTEVHKKTLNPVFNVDFSFTINEILYDTQDLKITVWDWDLVGSHEFMGTMTVPLKEFPPKVTITKWYTLVGENSGTQAAPIGDLRLKFKYTKQKVFPLVEYRPIMEMLFDTRMDLVAALADVTSERDLVAQTLCRIFEANCKTRQLMAFLTGNEIENSPNSEVLFRGNSVATKALDYYMKLVGLQYLNRTIGSNIKDIYESKKSCEVDPTKTEKGENIEKNMENLVGQVTGMFLSITCGMDDFPMELRDVFADVCLKVKNKFGQDNPARYTAVSGFVILRYFAASILGPKLFGLAKEHPGQMASRTLTLIAKIIQNLGNLVEFGQKEPYMAPMNVFIQESLEPMKSYIESISMPTSSGFTLPSKKTSEINLEYELAVLYDILKKDADTIGPKLATKYMQDKFTFQMNSLIIADKRYV